MKINFDSPVLTVLIAFSLYGCAAPTNPENSTKAPVNQALPTDTSFPPPTKLPAPERLLAFGDVHGDLAATIQILTMAGVVSSQLDWIGGQAIVVQVGDQLDRGSGEKEILDLFEHLAIQARDAGGGFYPLLGNHEIMNVEEDFQ